MSTNVTYTRGNIFTSTAQSLVNTVNCVRVMGAGIALEFKYRYPEMFKRYAEICHAGQMKVGLLYIYEIPDTRRKVINFPTKKEWKNPSKMEYLEQGLRKFLETYREKKVESAAFPLLGAQHGGLDPAAVRVLMMDYLSRIDIPIEIYEYAPEAKDDLIDEFTEVLFYNKKEFRNSTGLTDTQVERIREKVGELNSLIQLTKIKGVGEETVKACFQFAMKVKEGKITEPAIFGAETAGSGHSLVKEPEESYEQGHDERGSTMEERSVTDKGKKAARKGRKQRPPKTLTMGQKQLLTDLPAEVIEKIECGSMDVTIGQLMAYATGMKKNPKKLVNDKYFKKSGPTPGKTI